MILTNNCHDIAIHAMLLPCYGYDIAMSVPWYCHAIVMILLSTVAMTWQ
jgi:hypothetical protein